MVIPLRGFDREPDQDLAVPHRHIEPGEELEAAPTTAPAWGRVPMPLPRRAVKDRVFGWVVASRRPLVASALCLAVTGVVAVNAMGAIPTLALASPQPSGSETGHGVQPIGLTPPLVSKPDRPAWSVSVEARLNLGERGVSGVPGVAGASPVVPGAPGGPVVHGVSPGLPAAGATAVLPVVAASSPPGAGIVTPSTVYTPPATGPVTPPSSPSVVPGVAAPVVLLTAAQQTAADAAAAAALTAATAKSAAALTAATARSAADLTAANAAAAAARIAAKALAAAEATRLQALADAYAVAHPAG